MSRADAIRRFLEVMSAVERARSSQAGEPGGPPSGSFEAIAEAVVALIEYRLTRAGCGS